MRRFVLLAGSTIFLIALALGAYIYLNLPKRTGELEIAGLENKVEVSFDSYGVPHIFASSEHDAYRALGYVHAQDRLFQMDLYRRVAQGRLSEIFGEDLLEADKYFRTLGIHKMAKKQWDKTPKESKVVSLATAYLEGVNFFASERVLPPEFQLLGYQPEPFTITDSLAILNYMGTTFGDGLKTDLLLTAIREKVGDEMVGELDFAHNASPKPLSASIKVPFSEPAFAKLDYINKVMDKIGRFNGSNAWLIPASRSKSGKPILANDTHIKFSNPPVWYEAQLSYPGSDLMGHFLAGVPFALLGQTRTHAYGITIFLGDTLDVVADKKAKGEEGVIVRNHKAASLSKREETIKIKGGSERTLNVYESEVGPVINHIFPSLAPDDVYLSLYSTIMDENANPLVTTYQFGQSNSIEEFEKNASQTRSPSLNLFYAHKDEGVAWIGVGKVREQSKDFSEFFVQNYEDFAPKFLSFDKHPKSINPKNKIVANTNHHPEGEINFAGYYPYPSRIERLKELLETKEKWSIEELKHVQTDTKVNYFEPFKNTLTQLKPKLTAKDWTVAQKLLGWDGHTAKDSIEATLLYEWMSYTVKNISVNHLGEGLSKRFAKNYMSLRSVVSLLESKDSKWWDDPKTPEIESRNDMLSTSLSMSLQSLRERFGDHVENWSWGKLHTLELEHPLGRVPLLSKVFNTGPSAAHGGLESINTYSFDLIPGNKPTFHGAATRRLIDMSSPEKSYGVIPGGQSGNI